MLETRKIRNSLFVNIHPLYITDMRYLEECSRRTTSVVVGRFQSFLSCPSACLESATHISSSNGLCQGVQAQSKS